jgi:hypothetical protein
MHFQLALNVKQQQSQNAPHQVVVMTLVPAVVASVKLMHQ